MQAGISTLRASANLETMLIAIEKHQYPNRRAARVGGSAVAGVLPPGHELVHQRYEASIVRRSAVNHFMHDNVLNALFRLLRQLSIQANRARMRVQLPTWFHLLHKHAFYANARTGSHFEISNGMGLDLFLLPLSDRGFLRRLSHPTHRENHTAAQLDRRRPLFQPR